MDLLEYAARIERDLRENILPCWLEQVPDRARETFHGELDNTLRVNPSAERGALLSARILWTFAAAYQVHRDPAYRAMAHYAYRDLKRLYRDSHYGGFIWSVHPDGSPARTRKQVYGQAFALYALAAYHEATGHPEALNQAIGIFRLLEEHARDRVHGGYLEAFARDWTPIEDMRLSDIDLNAPKSQNTHLHIMEAYTALLRVWPDPELREAQSSLLAIMLDRVLDASGRHLGLFFTRDWQACNDTVSYGHDIEAAWLLTEAAEGLGDARLLARVQHVAVGIAEDSLQLALDTDGALLYEGNAREGVTRDDKEWWPQAEAMVGFLNAYQISRDARFLRAALGLWDFIEMHLIDREHGEWFRATDRAGRVRPSEAKVSFWKCPYHNGRAGLEAPARLRAIARDNA
jgi:cellobiose epimerase